MNFWTFQHLTKKLWNYELQTPKTLEVRMVLVNYRFFHFRADQGYELSEWTLISVGSESSLPKPPWSPEKWFFLQTWLKFSQKKCFVGRDPLVLKIISCQKLEKTGFRVIRAKQITYFGSQTFHKSWKSQVCKTVKSVKPYTKFSSFVFFHDSQNVWESK